MNIILDKLSFKTVIIIFFKFKNSTVYLLEKNNKYLSIFSSKLFKLKKIKILNFNQKISQLNIYGENLFDYIHDISKKETFLEIENVLKEEKKFESLNQVYKKNSIKLFIIKIIDKEYRLYLRKIFYALAILKQNDNLFIFQKPQFINLEQFLKKKNIRYFFYTSAKFTFNKKYLFCSHKGIYLRIFLKKIIGKLFNNKFLNLYLKYRNIYPNILCLTDNNYSNYSHLRRFPSWDKKNDYNIIAYDQSNLFLKKSFLDNKSYINKIFYFDISVIDKILKFLDNNIHNNKIVSIQNELAKKSYSELRYKNISKELIIFFNEVQIILSLCNFFKIKLFISSQTHLSLNLAADVVSKILNFETINFQYSFAHTKSHSLVLLSNADNLLLFSNKFNNKFSNQKIFEPKIYEIGYIFKATEELKKKSLKLRDSMEKNGCKFIISYFDEGVKFDKWKLSHKDLILKDLSKLLKFILKNSEFGLIVKPQFAFHKPSNIFKDKIFRDALKTGRYLEVVDGSYRNNILPFQTAMASDFSIGYYFGGTACVESSLINKPTVMLNPFSNRGNFDKLMENNNIIYKDIDEIIKILTKLKSDNQDIQKYKKFNEIISSSIFSDTYNKINFENIIADKINVQKN